MMEEGYVSHALSISEHIDGRWIANQQLFERPDAQSIDPKLKAILVTATAIYASKLSWSEREVDAALAIQTYGDARALVARLHPKAGR